MADLPQNFLFGLPNSIQSANARRLCIFGMMLVCIGIVEILNASLSTGFGAVKQYRVHLFFNTHWISSIYLLAGLSSIYADNYKQNYFLFLTVFLSLATICVGIGSAIASCVNINTVGEIGRLRDTKPHEYAAYYNYAFSPGQSIAAYVCGAIDIICNAFGIGICVAILKEIYGMSLRYFAAVSIDTSRRRIAILGILITVCGISKLILWISEIIWFNSSSNNSVQFYFINYTFDEPIWTLIYAVSGCLTLLVAFRGSRIVMHCALVLTSLSYFPAIYYFWIDYRWTSQTQMAQFTVLPKSESLTFCNMAVGLIHILLILPTVFELGKKLADGEAMGFRFSLNLDSNLRRTLGKVAMLLMLLGVAFLVSDILNIQAKTFFRVFWPTEQQLPFGLIPASIVLYGVLQEPKINYLLVPGAFVLLLYCAQYTLFHITAYLYLSSIQYGNFRICKLFSQKPYACGVDIEREGAVIHWIEAVLALLVLGLCVFTAIVLGRIMGLHAVQFGQQQPSAQRTNAVIPKSPNDARIKRNQCYVWILGGLHLVLALFLISFVAYEGVFSSTYMSEHPLFILHGTIKITCSCTPFVMNALILLLFGKDLHLYPLRSIALIALYAVRITETFTLLDNLNMPLMSTGTQAIFYSYLVGLGLCYFSVVLMGLTLDLSVSQAPEFDFSDELADSPAVVQFAFHPSGGSAASSWSDEISDPINSSSDPTKPPKLQFVYPASTKDEATTDPVSKTANVSSGNTTGFVSGGNVRTNAQSAATTTTAARQPWTVFSDSNAVNADDNPDDPWFMN